MKRAKASESPDSGESLDEFEVPDGWRLATIEEVCEVNPPRPPKDFLSADAPVTFVPMPAVDADLGAITNPELKPYLEVRNGFTSFRDGDVIMAKITPCMENGKASIIHRMKNGIGFGSTEFHVMRSHGEVLPEYIYHFIRQKSFRREAESHFTGSVGQKRVPADFIKHHIIPLPSLAEQRRIVARVEALLAQVNAARNRLSRVPLIMKKFRQAVLAAACEGRLTEGWREENPDIENASSFIEKLKKEKLLQDKKRMKYLSASDFSSCSELPSTWGWVKLWEIAIAVDVDHKMPKGIANGIPLISPKDFVDPDKINFKDTKKISQEDYERMCRKITPENGDILLSRYGTIGKVRKVPVNEKFQISYNLCLIRPFLDIKSNDYLYWILQSMPVYHQVLANDKSSSIPDLGIKDINNFTIPLPPLAEQHEIVRRVNALFEREDQIEQQVVAATKRTEALTQAVLGKAFKGELVAHETETC